MEIPEETIVLTYKPGVTFNPCQTRQVLQPQEVGVVQIRG
jgi:hypothetical protein